jgi:DNA polymerase-3 subunit gamma/tau
VQGKVRHAYLFTGPRGTGKTTTARLLAKAVNCLAPEAERPCNTCSLCKAITEGRLLDLIEIDAASNRGIDEIRDIREKVGFRPSEGRYKLYVLDEAHMLTEPAFNALLKTLEEPPPHVIFALVTTDPHKIPATIMSRCQRFDFRRVPMQAIVGRLAHIAEQEGVSVEPAAMETIARHGTGAMRDAISLLDQLTSYGQKITLDQVQMVLGTMSSDSAARLVQCLVDRDLSGGLELINRTVADGAEPRQFSREAVEYLRALLLVHQGAGPRLLDATTEQAAVLEALAQRVSIERLLRAIRLFSEAATELKRGLQIVAQLPLELALVESTLDPDSRQSSLQGSDPPDQAHSGSPPVRVPQSVPLPSRVAEQTSTYQPDVADSAQRPAAAAPAETPVQPHARSSLPAQAGELTLSAVEQSWAHVLNAVRRRNPTTQAVLNTGCRPVEVNGDVIVMTFPFAHLLDKLSDPQRQAELQDALAEVMQSKCRIKLVPASQYVPSLQEVPVDHPPTETAAKAPAPEIQEAPGVISQPARRAQPKVDAGPENAQIPEEIARWAEKHGGEVSILPP